MYYIVFNFVFMRRFIFLEAGFVFFVFLPRASWTRGRRRNGGNLNAQAHFLLQAHFYFLKLASCSLYSYRELRELEVRGGMAATSMRNCAFFVASPFRRRAAYGNRTRLLGLGSRCTTDVVMPQQGLQKYNFFCNYANIFCLFNLLS